MLVERRFPATFFRYYSARLPVFIFVENLSDLVVDDMSDIVYTFKCKTTTTSERQSTRGNNMRLATHHKFITKSYAYAFYNRMRRHRNRTVFSPWFNENDKCWYCTEA